MKLNFSIFSQLPIEDKPKTLRDCILEDLEKTKCELETAYLGFDNVTDPDLIDCYIYEVNAIMKRYRYLLNQAATLSQLPEENLMELNTESTLGVLV
ncbi:MAG: YaaL family protein [Lachnospiraceae bacterium]|nr:YaaL family protein [Lachnospiraceae bacterium]